LRRVLFACDELAQLAQRLYAIEHAVLADDAQPILNGRG